MAIVALAEAAGATDACRPLLVGNVAVSELGDWGNEQVPGCCHSVDRPPPPM